MGNSTIPQEVVPTPAESSDSGCVVLVPFLPVFHWTPTVYTHCVILSLQYPRVFLTWTSINLTLVGRRQTEPHWMDYSAAVKLIEKCGGVLVEKLDVFRLGAVAEAAAREHMLPVDNELAQVLRVETLGETVADILPSNPE